MAERGDGSGLGLSSAPPPSTSVVMWCRKSLDNGVQDNDAQDVWPECKDQREGKGSDEEASDPVVVVVVEFE